MFCERLEKWLCKLTLQPFWGHKSPMNVKNLILKREISFISTERSVWWMSQWWAPLHRTLMKSSLQFKSHGFIFSRELSSNVLPTVVSIFLVSKMLNSPLWHPPFVTVSSQKNPLAKKPRSRFVGTRDFKPHRSNFYCDDGRHRIIFKMSKARVWQGGLGLYLTRRRRRSLTVLRWRRSHLLLRWRRSRFTRIRKSEPKWRNCEYGKVVSALIWPVDGSASSQTTRTASRVSSHGAGCLVWYCSRLGWSFPWRLLYH